MNNKTTDYHFQLFKEECQKWLGIFGMKGWRVDYFHSEDIENSRASYSLHLTGRVCSFYLSPKWDKLNPVTDKNVKISAFHEVCHVLLARLVVIGESRFVHADEFNEEAHAIIRILENVLWKE